MALTLGLMALVSCNKDKETSKEAVFTATLEQHVGQQGRTAIDPENGNVKWLAGDKILIANGNGETAQFTLQSGPGTTEGTFRTAGEFEMEAPFTAAYPQNATISGTTATFTLPATQTLTQPGTFANGANPMAAYASDGNLYFRNLCGALDIRLLGDNVHMTGIRITGVEGEMLNGTFAVDCSANDSAIMANQGSYGTNIVTLNCDVTLTSTTTAQEFFIVLPVGALEQGFTMEVLDGENVICTKQLETNLAQIVRNEVKRFNPLLIGETPTPIELPDVVTNAVTDITTTTATAGGEILSDGGSTITECGVCWSTEQEPTIDSDHMATQVTMGEFSVNLAELTPNTTYYVRAYATNEAGTGYGVEVTFTTEEEVPTIPEGAINGLFTINDNGDQVYFSQGNLQYQASANTWRFAENQYDYIGDANSNISQTYSGWIDLFGWGTSGYDHGANAYQPWSTSQTNSDYCAYGSDTYNLNDQTGQADWGYNAISNGGNTTHQWRTLTKDEWVYVFDTRSTSSGIRYAKAQVNNVNGVILLPDDWSTDYYSLSSTNTYNANFSNNVISASSWTNSLQSHGAVFLPAAGTRDGTSVSNVGSIGYYWSASRFYSSAAYIMNFYGSHLSANGTSRRYSGRSVRLACLAEN